MVQIQELRTYDIFSELDMNELGLLTRIAEETYATEGEILIQVGVPARTLYIMDSGNLMVAFPDGRAFTLHKPGSLVGWSAIVHPSAYIGTVTCLTDCTLIAFPGNELLRLIQSNVKMGTKLVRKISQVVSTRLNFLPEDAKRRLNSGR